MWFVFIKISIPMCMGGFANHRNSSGFCFPRNRKSKCLLNTHNKLRENDVVCYFFEKGSDEPSNLKFSGSRVNDAVSQIITTQWKLWNVSTPDHKVNTFLKFEVQHSMAFSMRWNGHKFGILFSRIFDVNTITNKQTNKQTWVLRTP